MPEQGVAGAAGYRAFISYSHRDDAVAKTLHRRLETYRLPKKLIGAPGERGPIPARLTPIFRDLDELSAADDLSVEIKAALARSEVLIILCSPGAKASKWVNLEIETFRALHGGSRPVLAALIEGEPAEAFPPALTAEGHEPVAADFRKSRDGKRLALLKLVAGIAGAPLDALVQRDAQRQNRRVMAITGGALAAALTMALLLIVALRSQAEAQRQRAEAEGLVEYMLTDLRDKLKGVGRLDVMTAVNERAMKYYGEQQDLDDLPTESLLRRARILHAMGEDDEKRGDIDVARRKFTEAHRTTSNILIRQPNDTEVVFAHSQSEYWLGYIALRKDKRFEMLRGFRAYKKFADQLVKLEPNKIEWQKEAGYAEGNLCTAYLETPLQLERAVSSCRAALLRMQMVDQAAEHSEPTQRAVANRFGWLADAFHAYGLPSEALKQREHQSRIVDSLISKNPDDANNIEAWLTAKYALGLQQCKNGDIKSGRDTMKNALFAAHRLSKFDNNNKQYHNWVLRISEDIIKWSR